MSLRNLFCCEHCESFLQNLTGLKSHITDYHHLELDRYTKNYPDYDVRVTFLMKEQLDSDGIEEDDNDKNDAPDDSKNEEEHADDLGRIDETTSLPAPHPTEKTEAESPDVFTPHSAAPETAGESLNVSIFPVGKELQINLEDKPEEGRPKYTDDIPRSSLVLLEVREEGDDDDVMIIDDDEDPPLFGVEYDAVQAVDPESDKEIEDSFHKNKSTRGEVTPPSAVGNIRNQGGNSANPEKLEETVANDSTEDISQINKETQVQLSCPTNSFNSECGIYI